MEQKIRDYQILEKIGEGGMGEVYLAEDENLGRRVAIKALFPELTRNEQFVERFKQEARVQASLLHTNIVTLHSFFSEGPTYYMVMEYAKGMTLKELIQKTGLLPEERALKILRQLLDGVGYAHAMGVVHRDIKPSNIIIDEKDTVKIMDFGIAKLLGDKGMTKTGAKLGTLYYMSPEQVKAVKDIDGRTDIYSLGITLYEMLTGNIPFNAKTDSDFEVMKEIIEATFPDPRDVYPHISDSTVSLLNRMVEKDRTKRPASGDECFSDGGVVAGNKNTTSKRRSLKAAEYTKDIPTVDRRTDTTELLKKAKVEEQSVIGKADTPVRKEEPRHNAGRDFGRETSGGHSYMRSTGHNFDHSYVRSTGNNFDRTSDRTTPGKDMPSGTVSPAPKPPLNPKKKLSYLLPIAAIVVIAIAVGFLWNMRAGSSAAEDFVLVKGGTFQMGGDGDYDGKPVHSVTVADFSIGKYEVTQKEWRSVVGTNPSENKGDNLPVTNVSWNDIQEYMQKLNQKNDGHTYRLPTEAEWEYAARGGASSRGYTYSGGDTPGDVAWFTDNSGEKTHEIGTKQPNELGIYDMSGNVWEWCSDWYDENYYSSSPNNNPHGPGSSDYRVLRGGSWGNSDGNLRSAFRNRILPGLRYGFLGFRCARI